MQIVLFCGCPLDLILFGSIHDRPPGSPLGWMEEERTHLKLSCVSGVESGGCPEGCLHIEPHMSFYETMDGKAAREKAWHFINVSLGARICVWDGHWLIGLTGRSICPCVQSNPHQGQLLQFHPMELLSKHKLWINSTLIEDGMGSVMG